MIKARRVNSNVCPRCGGQDVDNAHFYSDVVDFKGLTLEVDGLVRSVCRTCELVWTSNAQDAHNVALMKDAFASERDRMRAELGLLSGEEVARALEVLGLSKSDAAALLGGGPNAFAKYISGEVLQSVPMDRLIRMTVAFGKHALEFLRSDAVQKPPVLYSGGFVPTTSAATPSGSTIMTPGSRGKKPFVVSGSSRGSIMYVTSEPQDVPNLVQ